MGLHNEIMNVRQDGYKRESVCGGDNDVYSIYNIGHRDARHAAAELSLKYESYIIKLEELASELQDSLVSGVVDLNSIRKECGL